MKKSILIIAIMAISMMAQAQTTDYYWHVRGGYSNMAGIGSLELIIHSNHSYFISTSIGVGDWSSSNHTNDAPFVAFSFSFNFAEDPFENAWLVFGSYGTDYYTGTFTGTSSYGDIYSLGVGQRWVLSDSFTLRLAGGLGFTDAGTVPVYDITLGLLLIGE